jgi:phage virion morphogenesis protein
MKISIDSTHAIKGLNNILSKVSNTAPLMEEIAGFLADVTEDAFQGEYDPSTGAGWTGLLPATIKARTRKGHWPGKILSESGNLASSVVTNSSDDFAEIGTNKTYGAAHQFGVDSFSDRSGELPERPFIGFSPQDADDIEQMIAEYLN